MSEAYLIGGVRTPVGRYGGALADVRPDDLAALVVRQAVALAGVPVDAIDEVVLGAANQAGEDNRNVARMAVLLAGLPDHIPGITVNRLCASGMSAIAIATNAVRAGDADIVVAGGVESMTRAPWVQAKPARAWAKPGEAFDTSIGWRFTNPRLAARDKATFSMPENEGPRRETTAEALARLRPVVAGGEVVTAGNSSPLSDGASAVVVASGLAVERHGLRPRARIVAHAAAALAPEIMGLGPVPATEKALAKAGLTVADLAAVELNEAFATQALASIRRLGLDPDIVNADGGAIALGHPLGSSGSRLMVTLLGRLEREDARYGLATMCVGVGQGTALIVERVDAAASTPPAAGGAA
ncbi:MAG: 3-oxoadipyl-CoA thiolase [Microbacterium sp.]|nr:MAG: 3-oxoadipyl-CoA thiolase [Microbacterium sp.]PZU36989.1 MAG: 3-oxoadipyl-CoA thiolase [Microbacterium sp.]